MDVDEQEVSQPSQPPTNPQSSSRISSSFVIVDDNHPFELDSYISNYTGRTAIDRLIHIVSLCPSVAVDAFKLAVQLIQKSRDPALFQTLCHAYEQVSAYSDVRLPSLSELPAIQSKWADETLKKNHSEKMKLEAELKNYSNNMIKESIRVCVISLITLYHSKTHADGASRPSRILSLSWRLCFRTEALDKVTRVLYN